MVFAFIFFWPIKAKSKFNNYFAILLRINNIIKSNVFYKSKAIKPNKVFTIIVFLFFINDCYILYFTCYDFFNFRVWKNSFLPVFSSSTILPEEFLLIENFFVFIAKFKFKGKCFNFVICPFISWSFDI